MECCQLLSERIIQEYYCWCGICKKFLLRAEAVQVFLITFDKSSGRWTIITENNITDQLNFGKSHWQRKHVVLTHCYVTSVKTRGTLFLPRILLRENAVTCIVCPMSNLFTLFPCYFPVEIRSKRPESDSDRSAIWTLVWTDIIFKGFGNNGRNILVPKFWSDMKINKMCTGTYKSFSS